MKTNQKGQNGFTRYDFAVAVLSIGMLLGAVLKVVA